MSTNIKTHLTDVTTTRLVGVSLHRFRDYGVCDERVYKNIKGCCV